MNDRRGIVFTTQTMMPPCKDCKKRKLGCHQNCKDYIQFKETNEKVKQKIRSEKLENSSFVAGYIPRKRGKR